MHHLLLDGPQVFGLENIARATIQHVEETVVHALGEVRGLPIHGQHLTAGFEHRYGVEVR